MKKKYIIVNCYNGIGIVFVKTKELIQYIEKFSKLNKNICCSNEKIYILNIEQIRDNTNLKSNNIFTSRTSNYGTGSLFGNSSNNSIFGSN